MEIYVKCPSLLNIWEVHVHNSCRDPIERMGGEEDFIIKMDDLIESPLLKFSLEVS